MDCFLVGVLVGLIVGVAVSHLVRLE